MVLDVSASSASSVCWPIADLDRGYRTVLHDRPPSQFRRTGAIHQAELFRRLIPDLVPELPNTLLPKGRTYDQVKRPETLFTILHDGMPSLRPDRPALVISSTSWTADEDFSLLTTALDGYQAAINGGAKLPKVFVIITGKGALRPAFEQTVLDREAARWTDIVVRCHFMPARDYPTLLGCADLGVSLHTSSSGRDLPMKVVDMFGCEVPVLAKGFACVDELVKHGHNGLVFETGAELGEQLIVRLLHLYRDQEADRLEYIERVSTFFKIGSPPIILSPDHPPERGVNPCQTRGLSSHSGAGGRVE